MTAALASAAALHALVAPLRFGAAPSTGHNVTVTDFFCGAGGSSTGAAAVPGVQVVMASNHWKLAIESHNTNHPDTDHDIADLSGVDPRRYPRTDIAWFSPECFPAGTTILTRRGLVPIEEVVVGDEVQTHRLRWRPVTAVMSKSADTVVVAGQGHGRLETTAEHPFYARTSERRWDNEKRQYRREYGAPEWVPAGELSPPPPSSRPGVGYLWASPTEFGDEMPVPTVYRRGVQFDADFWWFVGRWLGDGCLRASRGEVQVTCGLHEAEDLEKRLAALAPPAAAGRAGRHELRWSRRDIRTASVFSTGHTGLAEWLRLNFGEHAGGKTMPTWALTMQRTWREALLEGYASADGSLAEMAEQRPVQVCHSISRRLAVGVRLLALSLGWKANLTVSDKRTEGVIEGRRVKMQPLWRVSWCVDPSPAHNYSVQEDGVRWSPVRKTQPGRTGVEVFNLSVAEDESYVADGIIVHNCTTWSQARGQRRDYADQASLFDAPLPDEATVRSRATMGDVIRFTEHHRYEVVIVENVVDIRAWTLWDEWIGEMRKLGYQHREVYMNSMHAWGVGPATPQSRDRIYVVFWKVGNRAPNFDKWLSPPAWCPNCVEWVRAKQWWKDPTKQSGKYGARAQYLYRCPTERCHQVLDPAALPAAVAIDWSLPAQRIGERAKPLAPKTRARIAAGIKRYARPFTLEAAGHTFERTPGVRTWPADSPLTTLTGTATRAIACPPMLVPAGGSWRDEALPVTEPMSTRTTRENDGLAIPPLLVPVEGRDGKHARPASEPMRTQTGRGETGMAIPPFMAVMRSNAVAQGVDEPLHTISAGGGHHGLVVPLRTHGTAGPTSEPLRTLVAGNAGMALVQAFLTTLRGDHPQDSPLSDPMATVCASGNHLGLVMRNNSSRSDGAEMVTPSWEPLRALTTKGHQSVLTCPQDALYSYDTGRLNGLGQPLPTQTTVDGDALMHLADTANLDDPEVLQRIVDECTFRMLAPAEMALGMAFPQGYVVLGNKGERTKQIGNAVTPPVARDLIAAAVEAITGEEIAA